MKLFRRLLSLSLAFLLLGGIAMPAGLTARAESAALIDLAVNTPASRTDYIVGESLDLTGLTVKLFYENDTNEIAAISDFEKYGITTDPADGAELTHPGTHIITVSSGKLSDGFKINVTKGDAEIAVSGLSVNNVPDKTDYIAGDSLDLSGLTVKLHFSDDSSEIIPLSDFEKHGITADPVQGSKLSEPGKFKVSIVCGEFSDSFEISVGNRAEESARPVDLTINTLPQTTEYIAGDSLDLAGLTVKLHFSDDSSEIIPLSDFEKHGIETDPENGTELKEPGKYKVAVLYGELGDSFEISVSNRAPGQTDAESMTLNTLPDITEYTIGDSLDLAGLTVKLHFGDGSSEIIPFSDFEKHGIETDPKHGSSMDEAGDRKVVVLYGDLQVSFDVSIDEKPADDRQIDRIYGSDRYATAFAVSAAGWDHADTVIIASGRDFADALAGAALSKASNAPVLLADAGDNSALLDEIERLGAEKAYILGGEGAVDAKTEKMLADRGLEIVRLSGSDRYATAAVIAGELRKISGDFDKIFIVSGESYADALSAGYAAAMIGSPILYTSPDQLSAATESFIRENSITEAVIIGGEAAVSESAAAQLDGIIKTNRISGSDRYATSLEVARAYFTGNENGGISIATGKNFPDALTGGALAIKRGQPVLLVGDEASDELLAYLEDLGITNVTVFGGESAVSSEVIESLKG